MAGIVRSIIRPLMRKMAGARPQNRQPKSKETTLEAALSKTTVTPTDKVEWQLGARYRRRTDQHGQGPPTMGPPSANGGDGEATSIEPVHGQGRLDKVEPGTNADYDGGRQELEES